MTLTIKSACGSLTSTRYVLAYLAFAGLFMVYMLRVNLSVAILVMVKDDGSSQTSDQAECPPVDGSSNSSQSIFYFYDLIHPEISKFLKYCFTIFKKHNNGPKYDWDTDLQGQILGSFFYGYIVTQIPGGWLAAKYGGKKLFGFGVLCTSLLTLLTPLAAEWNVYVLIAVRVLEGLGEGVTFPAMHALWAKWAPPLEKSKLICLSYAGGQLGTVVGLPLSGVIIDQLGWPWVFYIFGALGCLWFIIWMIMTSDSPSTHKTIKPEEKDYILSEIEKTGDFTDPMTLRNTPWLEMAGSPAVWANCTAFFTHNWGFYTLLTCLPRFLKDVLQFDISGSSFLSGLPYLFMWLAMWISGYVVDTIREKRILSTVATRKIAVAIGLLVPAACLVGVGYVGCNYVLAVVLICVAGGFDGLSASGHPVNHLDIAPKYAGVLMGISNTFGTIPGFLAPEVVSWLTSQRSTSRTWRSVFYISAEIYVFGVIIFTVLGKGEVQPWAQGARSDTDRRDRRSEILESSESGESSSTEQT